MGTHTAEVVAALATSAAVVVALIAVVVAIWALRSTGRGTRAALAEVRHDRDLQIRPHLAFAPALPNVAIRDVALTDFPGIDPSIVADVLTKVPGGGTVIVCDAQVEDSGYGRLRNYGKGAAIDTRVRFVVDEVVYASGAPTPTSEWVEDHQAAEPDAAFTNPRDIAAGETGRIMHLPAVVSWDVFRTLGTVRGTAVIECTDIAGNRYEWSQPFGIWAFYPDPAWSWGSTRLLAQFGEVTRTQPGRNPRH
jgi:hypothetical protein